MGTTPNLGRFESVLIRLARVGVALAILYIGWLILTPYAHYLPADLSRGFLRNKSDFFYSSAYFIGFYAHILSAPFALLTGTLQMSPTLRRRRPAVHRRLGQAYGFAVLGFAAPGGLVMATRAYGGFSSVLCFALISVLAWWFTFAGWRAAVQRRYASHGRWMMRSYVMMCSAIALRLTHYLLQPLEWDAVWTYQLSAWLSWLPWLVALECVVRWPERSSTESMVASNDPAVADP